MTRARWAPWSLRRRYSHLPRRAGQAAPDACARDAPPGARSAAATRTWSAAGMPTASLRQPHTRHQIESRRRCIRSTENALGLPLEVREVPRNRCCMRAPEYLVLHSREIAVDTGPRLWTHDLGGWRLAKIHVHYDERVRTAVRRCARERMEARTSATHVVTVLYFVARSMQQVVYALRNRSIASLELYSRNPNQGDIETACFNRPLPQPCGPASLSL